MTGNTLLRQASRQVLLYMQPAGALKAAFEGLLCSWELRVQLLSALGEGRPRFQACKTDMAALGKRLI